MLALAVMLAGCHHDQPPPIVAPDEVPPLPPASGTPIGYLVDGATQLKLADDQLSKLRDIDTGLAAELDVIDTQLRSTDHPVGANDPPPQQRRGGGRRGGMGGMGGSPSGSSHRGKRGAGAGSGSASPGHAADIGRLTEERVGDVKAALQRAFALLDPDQQVAARQLLASHGVDVDAVRPQAPPMIKPPSQRGVGSDDDGDVPDEP
jgi:hypothetical protein